VLERSLRSPAGKASPELWGHYLRLEALYGSPASVKAVDERRAAALPHAQPASLYQLASLHAFADLWPVDERELNALADDILTPAPAAAAGALPGGLDGAVNGVPGVPPAAMTVPNLSLCTEYTGEPVLLDAPQAAEGDSGAMARGVPYQIDALIDALPLRLVSGLKAETPELPDLARLFERLAQLPERLADLPAAASAMPGGGGEAWAAEGAVKRPPAADSFTARQRKKQQLFGH
jgi:hypothetical protein